LPITYATAINDPRTKAVEDVYLDLRYESTNLGVTDIPFLLGDSGVTVGTPKVGFELHRIGDAVASRDIYASIQEAYRLCSKL
jgi:hypothetical protein